MYVPNTKLSVRGSLIRICTDTREGGGEGAESSTTTTNSKKSKTQDSIHALSCVRLRTGAVPPPPRAAGTVAPIRTSSRDRYVVGQSVVIHSQVRHCPCQPASPAQPNSIKSKSKSKRQSVRRQRRIRAGSPPRGSPARRSTRRGVVKSWFRPP
jgi:hypothetical protein